MHLVYLALNSVAIAADMALHAFLTTSLVTSSPCLSSAYTGQFGGYSDQKVLGKCTYR